MHESSKRPPVSQLRNWSGATTNQANTIQLTRFPIWRINAVCHRTITFEEKLASSNLSRRRTPIDGKGTFMKSEKDIRYLQEWLANEFHSFFTCTTRIKPSNLRLISCDPLSNEYIRRKSRQRLIGLVLAVLKLDTSEKRTSGDNTSKTSSLPSTVTYSK